MWSELSTQALNEISAFLPRIGAALLILIIGTLVAKAVKRVVVKVLDTIRLNKAVENTPIGHFVQNAELGERIEGVIGSIVYWLLMLVVLHSAVAVVGLQPLTNVLNSFLAYIPNVFSAILVLFLGLLLAGIVESFVKGAIKTMDGKSARLLGKISSYLVVTMAVLIAISELGIARQYILSLFIGWVAMLALGLGLAPCAWSACQNRS